MNKSLQLTLCDTQGQLFELSGKLGYDSKSFIKNFMSSNVVIDLEKDFHHLQWAGKEYIFSRLEEECTNLLSKNGQIYSKEVLYWMGYIYRYWNYYTGESSKDIYKQAPAKTMNVVYLMYHTMSPKMTIDRLKETYQKNKRISYIKENL